MQVDPKAFEDRLKDAIKPARLKPWCERVGVNHSTLNSAFQRKTIPNAEILVQIGLALGKSLDWLLGLTNEPARMLSLGGAVMVEDGPRVLPKSSAEEESGACTDEPDWAEFIQVPLYAVKASVSHGAEIDRENVKSHLAFRHSFILSSLRICHGELYCIEVDGTSMEPALRDGHPALIDPQDIEILREGPYLLHLEGSLLIKNLQRLPGGRLRMWSENQHSNAHPPIEVAWPPAEGVDLTIVGRVRWSDVVF